MLRNRLKYPYSNQEKVAEKKVRQRKFKRWATVCSVALLCFGIVFMLIARHFNDIYQMWLKASNICLECIGIG